MFNKYLPKLDVHGEISQTADLLVSEFIAENYLLGEKKILIIHGIGNGTLKKAVHELLSKNKLVLNYKLDMFNIGVTIVDLEDNN